MKSDRRARRRERAADLTSSLSVDKLHLKAVDLVVVLSRKGQMAIAKSHVDKAAASSLRIHSSGQQFSIGRPCGVLLEAPCVPAGIAL